MLAMKTPEQMAALLTFFDPDDGTWSSITDGWLFDRHDEEGNFKYPGTLSGRAADAELRRYLRSNVLKTQKGIDRDEDVLERLRYLGDTLNAQGETTEDLEAAADILEEVKSEQYEWIKVVEELLRAFYNSQRVRLESLSIYERIPELTNYVRENGGSRNDSCCKGDS